MWLISDMVLKIKVPSLLYRYLPLLKCIFSNGICPFQVVPWTLFLYFSRDLISKVMAFKLHFSLFCYVAYFVYIYILNIFLEHIKLNATIQ